MIKNLWENEFESLRETQRKELGRITYDCFNCKQKDMRALCAKGYNLSLAEDKGLDLVDVLKGVTSGVCLNCKDYDGGE